MNSPAIRSVRAPDASCGTLRRPPRRVLRGLPADLAAKSASDPYGSVRVDVDIIQRDVRRPGFLVSGLVYDVSFGTVEVVVPPTAVPTA